MHVCIDGENYVSSLKDGIPGGSHRPGYAQGMERARLAKSARSNDLKQLKAVARNDALGAMCKLIRMDREQLDALVKNPNASAVQLMVAAVIGKTIREGDAARLQFLLSYIIGKPSTYDPEPEDISKEQRASLASIPSEVLIAALKTSQATIAAESTSTHTAVAEA